MKDLWEPLIADGRWIAWMRHDGAFGDLGRPSDFLRATLEALAGAFPMPPGAGDFDAAARVLTLTRRRADRAERGLERRGDRAGRPSLAMSRRGRRRPGRCVA